MLRCFKLYPRKKKIKHLFKIQNVYQIHVNVCDDGIIDELLKTEYNVQVDWL